MNTRIYDRLLNLQEMVPVEINPPATKEETKRLLELCESIPKDILEILEISSGIEINIPGTVFYSATELIRKVSINDEYVEMELYPLGVLSFGDYLFMRSDGGVVQFDHETGTVFLEWDSVEAFLDDEIENAKGDVSW